MKKILIPLLLMVSTMTADAAQVRQFIWGFDGKVVPERMNLLSVLVENATPNPFEGEVTLCRNQGVASRLGELFVEPCYLSPDSRRWVQFLVYVPENSSNWQLDLKPGNAQPFNMSSPLHGAPSRVVLIDPELFYDPGSDVKRFPENLFPVSVSCTDGLASVILDHEPRWEPAKRQAFLEWVCRGGIVHLAKKPDGTLPEFSGELAFLNSAKRSNHVGAGVVIRHDVGVAKLNAKYFEQNGYVSPRLVEGKSYHNFMRECFQNLRREIQPKHNWKLIYAMTVAYILLIGPAGLLIGRKLRDFRIATGYTLLVIGAFSAIFLVVGRRGYGESMRVTTLAYARQVDADAWDVTQWSNLFVTKGDWYAIKHPSTHNYYSTGQAFEIVNGRVQGGREGWFVVDIPLFSSREFVHRGRFAGPALDLSAEIRIQEDRLASFQIRQPLPDGARYAVAFYRGNFYDVGIDSRRMNESIWERIMYFKDIEDDLSRRRYGYEREEADETLLQFKSLIAENFGNDNWGAVSVIYPEPADQVELFIMAPQPAEFASEFGAGLETGWVCYHLTMNVEENQWPKHQNL